MNLSLAVQAAWKIAAQEAQARGFINIKIEHMLMGLLKLSEIRPTDIARFSPGRQEAESLQEEIAELKAGLTARGINGKSLRRTLRQALPPDPIPSPPGAVLHRSPGLKKLFMDLAMTAVKEGIYLLRSIHFLNEILDHPTPEIAAVLEAQAPLAVDSPSAGPEPGSDAAPLEYLQLGDLTETLKNLRRKLLAEIFGQDNAVHAFVEGLFNAEVLAEADVERKRPKAIFVFAGPPGVGKTFLAEKGALALKRPFKRFDMSGYSDQMAVPLLAGAQASYQAAREGQLTQFVDKNPSAVILFDEIEKAHLDVVHLFLQILDQGVLEDKFTGKNVIFRDVVIIFTTNAGRSLYDDPNRSGAPASLASFHRQTILGALKTEIDPRTRKPFFPQAIVSRLAAGYPLMFNRLGVRELEKIAEREIKKIGGLIQSQYKLNLTMGPSIPLCLVMREGAKTDARTVRAQSELFVKNQLFKFFSLLNTGRIQEMIEAGQTLVLDLDPMEGLDRDVESLFNPLEKPKVLIAVRRELQPLFDAKSQAMDVQNARDLAEAQNLLDMHEFDMVLLDLWFDSPMNTGVGQSLMLFDQTPMGARSVGIGRKLLSLIHEKHASLPCCLLQVENNDSTGYGADDELLAESLRFGGARGVIRLQVGQEGQDLAGIHATLLNELTDVSFRLHRQRRADELGGQGKVLNFDAVPFMDPREKKLGIHLRNLRLARAFSGDDVSGMISDAERPALGFQDVYGAAQAKTELKYIVDWLQKPRHFARMGLRPPKGILLYGPPGTGKTMLAKALAGESDVAFIAEAATNLVTRYVGSGPENVRALFQRARKYAPSILFIDEIDAVGRKRRGEAFNRAQEETLNSILIEMDGFNEPAAKPVIVIAATNLAETLDPALKRRFDREIEVDKPDREGRRQYLVHRLQGGPSRRVSDEVIDRLAGQSAGMTIADLERVVQLASRRAAQHGGVIGDDEIEESFEIMRMGEARERSTSRETLLRTARHEAGHGLMAWLTGEKPVQITIVARGGAGGFVETMSDETRMLYTKPELEKIIKRTLGGRAAEIIYYGRREGLSTGASNDLEKASSLAQGMVCRYGMSDGLGPLVVNPEAAAQGPLALKISDEIQGIVQDQQEQAVEILKSHKTSLDKLATALLEKNRLAASELEELLEGVC